MKPAELSHELRTGDGEHLRARRRVLGLALGAAGCMGVISLYQMGIVRHLPEPPIPRLNADKVDASSEAYAHLNAPDAVLGFASYAATMVLAATGGTDRVQTMPWIPLAMAGKVMGDALQAGRLTVDQWTKHRTFCGWCLVAAGLTFATVPAVLPEARAAWRQVRSR
ncbi:MAG TPA: vitamin K epoxide reductase family protein [Longimicrobiaceae bacterium]|nr:vitamin K epoxide reductase family protein [Longimicrobiaceae bacterium]